MSSREELIDAAVSAGVAVSPAPGHKALVENPSQQTATDVKSDVGATWDRDILPAGPEHAGGPANDADYDYREGFDVSVGEMALGMVLEARQHQQHPPLPTAQRPPSGPQSDAAAGNHGSMETGLNADTRLASPIEERLIIPGWCAETGSAPPHAAHPSPRRSGAAHAAGGTQPGEQSAAVEQDIVTNSNGSGASSSQLASLRTAGAGVGVARTPGAPIGTMPTACVQSSAAAAAARLPDDLFPTSGTAGTAVGAPAHATPAPTSPPTAGSHVMEGSVQHVVHTPLQVLEAYDLAARAAATAAALHRMGEPISRAVNQAELVLDAPGAVDFDCSTVAATASQLAGPHESVDLAAEPDKPPQPPLGSIPVDAVGEDIAAMLPSSMSSALGLDPAAAAAAAHEVLSAPGQQQGTAQVLVVHHDDVDHDDDGGLQQQGMLAEDSALELTMEGGAAAGGLMARSNRALTATKAGVEPASDSNNLNMETSQLAALGQHHPAAAPSPAIAIPALPSAAAAAAHEEGGTAHHGAGGTVGGAMPSPPLRQQVTPFAYSRPSSRGHSRPSSARSSHSHPGLRPLLLVQPAAPHLPGADAPVSPTGGGSAAAAAEGGPGSESGRGAGARARGVGGGGGGGGGGGAFSARRWSTASSLGSYDEGSSPMHSARASHTSLDELAAVLELEEEAAKAGSSSSGSSSAGSVRGSSTSRDAAGTDSDSSLEQGLLEGGSGYVDDDDDGEPAGQVGGRGRGRNAAARSAGGSQSSEGNPAWYTPRESSPAGAPDLAMMAMLGAGQQPQQQDSAEALVAPQPLDSAAAAAGPPSSSSRPLSGGADSAPALQAPPPMDSMLAASADGAAAGAAALHGSAPAAIPASVLLHQGAADAASSSQLVHHQTMPTSLVLQSAAEQLAGAVGSGPAAAPVHHLAADTMEEGAAGSHAATGTADNSASAAAVVQHRPLDQAGVDSLRSGGRGGQQQQQANGVSGINMEFPPTPSNTSMDVEVSAGSGGGGSSSMPCSVEGAASVGGASTNNIAGGSHGSGGGTQLQELTAAAAAAGGSSSSRLAVSSGQQHHHPQPSHMNAKAATLAVSSTGVPLSSAQQQVVAQLQEQVTLHGYVARAAAVAGALVHVGGQAPGRAAGLAEAALHPADVMDSTDAHVSSGSAAAQAHHHHHHAAHHVRHHASPTTVGVAADQVQQQAVAPPATTTLHSAAGSPAPPAPAPQPASAPPAAAADVGAAAPFPATTSTTAVPNQHLATSIPPPSPPQPAAAATVAGAGDADGGGEVDEQFGGVLPSMPARSPPSNMLPPEIEQLLSLTVHKVHMEGVVEENSSSVGEQQQQQAAAQDSGGAGTMAGDLLLSATGGGPSSAAEPPPAPSAAMLLAAAAAAVEGPEGGCSYGHQAHGGAPGGGWALDDASSSGGGSGSMGQHISSGGGSRDAVRQQEEVHGVMGVVGGDQAAASTLGTTTAAAAPEPVPAPPPVVDNATAMRLPSRLDSILGGVPLSALQQQATSGGAPPPLLQEEEAPPPPPPPQAPTEEHLVTLNEMLGDTPIDRTVSGSTDTTTTATIPASHTLAAESYRAAAEAGLPPPSPLALAAVQGGGLVDEEVPRSLRAALQEGQQEQAVPAAVGSTEKVADAPI